jgi:hypothetical protein
MGGVRRGGCCGNEPLVAEGFDPLPSRSAIYRVLVRHGLIDPQRRRRRRSDYRRWKRSRPMELWQKDITGGVHLDPRYYPSSEEPEMA